MQHKKDAALLRMIASVLDCNKAALAAYRDKKDNDIIQLFITASQDWINTYLPETISITISAAPKDKRIGYEHDLHIAMAHHCYSQGVSYNSKYSSLMCNVHDRLYSNFLAQETLAAENVDDNAEGAEKTHEHMEFAAMYLKFPYHNVMLLCFGRLLQDCLYGHTTPNSDADVQQNARALFKMSFANYESMTHKTATLASSKVTTCPEVHAPVTASECVEIAPEVSALPATDCLAAPTTLPKATNEIDGPPVSNQPDHANHDELVKNLGDTHTPTTPVGVATKQPCISDMGSYKSSVGIFILGMVNFSQKDHPYFLQNMYTSLRHLSELMLHGNAKAKQACLLINIPQLVQLVRDNIAGLSHTGTIVEIETNLLEIEEIELAATNEETTNALVDLCPAPVQFDTIRTDQL